MTGSHQTGADETTAADAAGGVFVSTGPLRTLARRAEFLAAARGPRQAMAGFVLQGRARPAPTDATVGIGFTCSRKVGNAVARNRAKRRLRALARDVLPRDGRSGWDYVLIGRAGTTAERDFAALRADLRRALAALHRRGGA